MCLVYVYSNCECMNEQGKLSEFKHQFNELENAHVKPHNINCYFYIVRFFLFYLNLIDDGILPCAVV